ncbi:hypothetical protein SSBR45G_23190 [Bradyrhizobium sp. SSBR45G]|nr:hypothetical protein SSBR45G_23190 [Bradyrhizobium sp. SSBR45G]GLH84483.1 hypothetical protein SSBR45R_19430 [Bradyrhizobium sp. SSBR45R]
MITDPVCPACSGHRTAARFVVSAEQAAQHFVQQQEHPDINRKLRSHIEELWGGRSCQIRACESCGFGFSWPFVAGDQLFYNLAYPYVAYPSDRWEFGRTLEALRGQQLQGKTMLEVGAGFGYFLDLLCLHGASASLLTATEYGRTASARLRALGYEVVEDDVRSDALLAMSSRFDFIFLFQVVEHMDRLDELFQRLARLGKAGARVFIAVPNTAHTNYQEAHESLIDMPPNHIGRWTIEAFRRIGPRHGFDVVEHETQPFDMRHFLRTDLVFSHVRRAQDHPGSLSGRVRSLPRSPLRTVLEAAAIAAGSIRRLPHWRSAYADRQRLGLSLWVQLKLL